MQVRVPKPIKVQAYKQEILVYPGSPLYNWLKYLHERLIERRIHRSPEPIPIHEDPAYLYEKLLPFLVEDRGEEKIYNICGVLFRAKEGYGKFFPAIMFTPIKGTWKCKEV